MVNKVTLIGNLGKDPEVRHFDNGGSVARLTLATNESYKDKEGVWQNQTEWHNVIAWRALADRAEKDLKKGSLVYVEGKIRTRSYKDNAGVDKYVTEVEALTLRSLDKREKSDNYNTPLPSQNDGQSSIQSPSTTNLEHGSTSGNMPVDDLPF